jgi:hypothetical protein
MSYKQGSCSTDYTNIIFLFHSQLYNWRGTQLTGNWHAELLLSWVSNFPSSCVAVAVVFPRCTLRHMTACVLFTCGGMKWSWSWVELSCSFQLPWCTRSLTGITKQYTYRGLHLSSCLWCFGGSYQHALSSFFFVVFNTVIETLWYIKVS